MHVALTATSAVIGALALAGCGLATTNTSPRASVVVTRDFGSRSVGSATEARVPSSQTMSQMLEREFRVATGDGGRAVTSIDGLSSGSRSLDWFLYVNGIQAAFRPAKSSVHRGDQIWWDLHDSTATASTPAVVGSFPEPFVHGTGGRRLPTVLACALDVNTACNRVAQELRAIGVSVANQALGTGSGTDSLSVVVGPWSDINRSLAADLIKHGPHASGVYAKFNGTGNLLELLDPRGQAVRALGRGAGLIAATSQGSASPTWLITGTDARGVTAAASAFAASRLDNHFALAVQGNAGFPVPQP
jgi:hypothetical protein